MDVDVDHAMETWSEGSTDWWFVESQLLLVQFALLVFQMFNFSVTAERKTETAPGVTGAKVLNGN